MTFAKTTLLLFSFLLIAQFSFGQCDFQHHKVTSPLFKDYQTGPHALPFNGQGGKVKKIEYSSVLSKGTGYRFVVHSQDGKSKGITLKIYDSKKQLIASNLDGTFQKEVIDVDVSSTGVYHIVCTFENSQSYCGFVQLGWKKG